MFAGGLLQQLYILVRILPVSSSVLSHPSDGQQLSASGRGSRGPSACTLRPRLSQERRSPRQQLRPPPGSWGPSVCSPGGQSLLQANAVSLHRLLEAVAAQEAASSAPL